MNARNYSELLADMKNYMSANQNKITDFNSGSIIMTMFEAVARIVERAYIDTRVGYQNNLRKIAYSIFDFYKKDGSYATVNLQFSRLSAGSSSVTIPVGTRVSDGTYYFVTTESGTINAGETVSRDIAAIAEVIGVDYNVRANTLTIIESSVPAEVIAVNNAVKATGGADTESDTEMLARFKEYINGLQGTNEYGIESGVLAIDGVRSVGLVEHFPPKNNIYNVTCYVDDGTGNLTDSLKEKIEDVINGTDESDNPGLKAAGIMIDVLPATQVEVIISVTCTIYRTETALAQAEILEALQTEINDLIIGEDVVWTSIILRLRRLSYVTDVSDLLINGSAENIAIGMNQIARFASASINIVSES